MKKNYLKWIVPFLFLVLETIALINKQSELIMIGILLFNITGFITFGVDKQKAVKGQWRIPEALFFLWAFFGSAIGIYIGMKHFRHKTKHLTFRIIIPLLSIWNIAWFYLLLMVLIR